MISSVENMCSGVVTKSSHTCQCLSHTPLLTKDVETSVGHRCKLAMSCVTCQCVSHTPLLTSQCLFYTTHLM